MWPGQIANIKMSGEKIDKICKYIKTVILPVFTVHCMYTVFIRLIGSRFYWSFYALVGKYKVLFKLKESLLISK